MKRAESPALLPAQFPWLLACAAITASPHALHQPIWLSAVAALLLAWRTALWRMRRALPARWLLLTVVIACVGGILLEYRTLFGRDAGVALLFLFAAMKPLEMRTRRDALVLVMLGYFLLLTHYFYSQAIAVGVWLLAASTVLTATLIRLSGDEAPAADSLRRSGLLLGQSLPFMLVLFLLFPRIQGPLWGLPQDAHAGLTGLSETMTPGSISELIQNGEIAFRARFEGSPPPPSRLYWRGPVLDAYDGRTWRPGPERLADGARIEALAPEVAYELTLEPHNQRWLLALDLPTALPPNARLTDAFELLAREPVRQRTRIALRTATEFRADAHATRSATPGESDYRLRRALQLPPRVNPRTRALAEQWRTQAGGDPVAVARLALAYFAREPFHYTLRPPLLGEQPIDSFLFETRRGFCEHYAAAFVFLLRAAGIPARVVTGYQGGEVNPVDRYVTVRQSDAHAWAEYWVAGSGWLRADPTAAVAPERVEQGIGAALGADEPLPVLMRIDADWLRQLRFNWEAMNNAWNQWVLGYNPERQREVLSRLGWRDADWRTLIGALTALCGIVLAAIVAWAVRHRPPRDPALRAWQGFCTRLARLGIVRGPAEGPLALAARTARERPDLAPVVTAAARHYARLRYGPSPDARDLAALRACRRLLPRPPLFRKRTGRRWRTA